MSLRLAERVSPRRSPKHSVWLDAYGYSVQQAADGVQGGRWRTPGAGRGVGRYRLAGIDGYEVGRRPCDSDNTRSIRLIALTGYGLADDQRRVLEAGFDMHLVKPVDIKHLQDALANWQLLGSSTLTSR